MKLLAALYKKNLLLSGEYQKIRFINLPRSVPEIMELAGYFDSFHSLRLADNRINSKKICTHIVMYLIYSVFLLFLIYKID